MADSHPKSKLKRRRTAVDEHQADTWRRGSVQRSTVPFSSQDPTRDVKTDGSKPNKGTVSPPTLTWWTRHDLSPSEKLWAIAMETVLPFLGPEVWDPLPKPSTVTPRQRERQRPFPANEVPPFPEAPGSPLQRPPPPLPVCSPAPPAGPLVTPPRGGGGGLQVPGTTAASGSVSPPHMRKEEDLEPPATHKVVQVGLVGRESVAEKTPQSRDLAERLIPPFPLWSGRTTTSKKAPLGRPLKAATWTLSGERRTDRMETTTTMRRMQEADVDERVVELEVEQAGPSGAQREGGCEGERAKEVGGGGGGGERLQCCPMCMLVFPSRFSQMDCDSHLAQCLSEMNVDMAW